MNTDPVLGWSSSYLFTTRKKQPKVAKTTIWTLVVSGFQHNIKHLAMNFLHPAGPIATYMYFASFVSIICLSAGASVTVWGGLEQVNGGQLARLELAGLFASSLQKEVKRCQYYRQ